eukprot:14599394-Alexandrium_andersonii.AAC.1
MLIDSKQIKPSGISGGSEPSPDCEARSAPGHFASPTLTPTNPSTRARRTRAGEACKSKHLPSPPRWPAAGWQAARGTCRT